MDIANEFQKIGISLTDNRFIAILEKMSTPPVPFIECHGMTSHQSAHDLAERRGPCSNKQMNMLCESVPKHSIGFGSLQE